MNTNHSGEADHYLSDRGVLPATAKTHQIEVVKFPAHEQLEKWLGSNGHKLDAAIVFPNLSRDVDGTVFPTGYSVRCFPPATREDGTSAKFLATWGIDYRPYVLPPVWDAASDTGTPLYIVEKQAAALLLWQAGLNVIALDGTWGAAAKRVDGEKVALHSVLGRFDWIGRPVFLCFDSDFRNRQSVLQGLVRTYTLFSIAGAVVRVILWDPAFKGLDDHVANKARLDLVRQREELDALTATVSALSAKDAASKWIIPQYRTLFEREIAAIQPGFSERSMLAECIFPALGTTAADLKKTWGVSTKEPAPPATSSIVDDTEAWEEPVDGQEIAKQILSTLKRHIVTTEVNYHAVTFWVLLSHLKDHVSLLPILGISSPDKRCGKTSLLLVLERLCWRSLLAASVTPAAVFRTISLYEPCFLIDEYDAFLAQNEEFRGVLNTCHTRGLRHIRCAPDTHEPQGFPTFCPVVIALIGELPATNADRTIAIRLERKWSQRKVDAIRKASPESFVILRRKIRRWVIDNAEKIVSADFLLPELVNDRAAENWETPAQIATILGDPWPMRAFTAARLLTPSDNDEQSFIIQLLLSLRRLFQGLGLHNPTKERIVHPTDKIVAALNLDKQAPWSDKKEYFHGLTAKKLGSELRKFKVRSQRDWSVKSGPHGYCWKDLTPVFERYLDDEPPSSEPPSGEPTPEPSPPSPSPSGQAEPDKVAETRNESSDPAVADVSGTLTNSSVPPDCFEKPPLPPDTPKVVSGFSTEAYHDLPLDHRIDSQKSQLCFKSPPPSTPAAGFWVPTHTERIVSVDLETFYPWPPECEITASERRRRKDGKAHVLAVDSRRNGIRLLTINTGSEIRVFDLFTDSVPDDIREFLRTSTLVMHHADFDATVLRRHGFELSSSIFDTMLASQLLSLGRTNPKRGAENDHSEDEDDFDPEEGFDACGEDRPAENDLASVVQRYLGVQMEKTKTNLGASDWSVYPLRPEQLEYAKADVAYFPGLVEALTDALKSAKLWNCFQERSEFFVHLNDIKFAGVPVNQDRLLHDQQTCEGLKLEKRAELKELFKDYRPPVPKSRQKKSKLVTADLAQGVVLNAEVETEEFNPNAPAQVVAALALHGIEVENTTKETLAGIDSAETHTLLAYKEHMALFTMIKGIARSVFPDSRVRAGGWNQLAARTGRIHSTHPNLQNLPRNWRVIFEVPDPYLWLKIDLSQIEMYVLALHCQDENLIALLATGRDVYVELAAEFFGRRPVRGEGPDEVNEILRSASKTLVLGISYCLGPRSFIRRVESSTRPSIGVSGMVIELEQATELYRKFFTMFPAVAANQEKAEADAHYEDSVYTVTGQRRFLPPLKNDQDEYTSYWPSLQFRKRVLVNTPIQGSAANLFLRAINKFTPALPTGVGVVTLVHDEIDLIITEQTAMETIAIVTHAFESSFAELFGDRLKVKMEYGIGKNWGTLKKVKYEL